jgi:uncharacterized protein (DUF2062 family)
LIAQTRSKKKPKEKTQKSPRVLRLAGFVRSVGADYAAGFFIGFLPLRAFFVRFAMMIPLMS